MPTALLFGASGQIGGALLPCLLAEGWTVHALSREARAAQPDVHWLQGGFASLPALPAQVDALISCGPLDLFGQWFSRVDIQCERVVAFGSTSLLAKADSVDAAERALVAKLAAGEQAVFETAARRGIAATVLRPTLVYGAGRDANLSRIAATARRLHGFVLPHDARGLRQPVHVDDLAQAAMAALGSPAAAGQAYALGGGEVLGYEVMVQRVLAVLPGKPRLWRVPAPMFRAALALAHATGRAQGFGEGALARLRQDLAFDIGPAMRDLGYAPRTFAPTAQMFTPPAQP